MTRSIYTAATCAAVILGFCLLSLGHAAVPDSLSYQGYLTDPVGTPIDFDTQITFSIYNVEIGGSPLWTTTEVVPLDQGLLSVTLGGASNPFPPDLFESPLWLGLSVESDEEMLPRRSIVTSAYAFRAQTAENVSAGSIDSNALAPGAVTQQGLAAGSVTADKIGVDCADGETLINTVTGWQCGSTSGTSCSPGDFLNCYSGPAGTAGTGVCRSGIRDCLGGSGFGPCEGEMFPDTETCDNLDNDCDGSVDNDAIDIATWYQDQDGDNFGDDSVVSIECFSPPGFVGQGADCDDGVPTTYPGAMEICNGVDDDCNLAIDDNCRDCTQSEADAINVCLDTCDDDLTCISECAGGIGLSAECFNANLNLGLCALSPCGASLADLNCIAEFCLTEYETVFGVLVPECAPPETQACYTGPAGTEGVGACQTGIESCGAFGFFGTCDSEVVPQPELCGDGVDNDCNGIPDDPAICTDSDSDGYTIVDDCDDTNPDVNPGATEICDDEIDNNCNNLIDNEDEETCADADNDGWVVSLDCDDSDPDVNPDATEICDNLDNDCDAQTDEDLFFGLEQCGPSNQGVCAGWMAAPQCVSGVITPQCQSSTPPDYLIVEDDVPFSCDDLDNDCDGQTDEDCLCAGGPGVCDDSLSCTLDDCDIPTDMCTYEILDVSCLIDGACYDHNQENPASSCLFCDSFSDPAGWTPALFGSPCPSGECDGSGICVPAPTVSDINPNFGSTTGDTAITVTGTGFQSGASVSIGGGSATSVVVHSALMLNAVTPPGAAGPADVTVTNPDGQSGSSPDLFAFVFQFGTCASPIVPDDLPFVYQSDTSSFSNDHFACTGQGIADGPDVVFSFIPEATGMYTIVLDGGFDTVLSVASDCADIVNSCLGASDTAGTETVSAELEMGSEVYIFVDGYTSSDSGPYSLEITGPN